MKKLNAIQREVLIGILLGDANLQTFNGGTTYRLRILQKNKNYVEHLYNIFKDFVTTPPKEISTKKGETRWYFNTKTFSCFRFYGCQFYDRKGKKKIPKLIHRWLTPRALAYWFMDDGSAKWKNKSIAVRFSTDCFSKKELKILCKAFMKSYDISPTLQKHRPSQYLIYIPTKYSLKFRDLVSPYIIDDMLYKCPTLWFLNNNNKL